MLSIQLITLLPTRVYDAFMIVLASVTGIMWYHFNNNVKRVIVRLIIIAGNKFVLMLLSF